MVEIVESEAAEASVSSSLTAVSGPFIKPESALVRAALDLMATHTVEGDGGESDSTACVHCGLQYPCPTVLHARQVVNAGGLDRVAA
jgi:hypothetical protein